MSRPEGPFPDTSAALIRLVAALREAGYHFVTGTPATHALVNARPENARARSMRHVFGWSRPFQKVTLASELFDLARRAGVLEERDGLWLSRLRASSVRDMIVLHSAFPTSGADAVFLGPDTYRFVSAIDDVLAQRRAPVRRAVDIGCGSGAGGLVVARACPSAQVLLTDINDAALSLAAVNAAAAGVSNVGFLNSDLFAGVEGLFDLIVANPPYLVDGAERRYRHGGGALGGALSERIAREAVEHLAPGGSLLLYTGSAIVDGRDIMLEALSGIASARGFRWRYREIDPDVFGEELSDGVYAAAERIAAVAFVVDAPA